MKQTSRIVASVLVPLLSFSAVVGTGFSTWAFQTDDNSAVSELNVRIEVKAIAEIGTVAFHENPLYQEHRLIIPSYTNGGQPTFSPALDWTYEGYTVAPECEYLVSWSATSGSAFYTEYLDFAGVDSEGMFLAPTPINDRLQEGGDGTTFYSVPLFRWKDGKEPTTPEEYEMVMTQIKEDKDANPLVLTLTIQYEEI